MNSKFKSIHCKRIDSYGVIYTTEFMNSKLESILVKESILQVESIQEKNRFSTIPILVPIGEVAILILIQKKIGIITSLIRSGHGLGWLRFGEFPRLVGRYCSCLLPKQNGGTSHIKVNPTWCPDLMNNPVHSFSSSLLTWRESLAPSCQFQATERFVDNFKIFSVTFARTSI